MRTGRHKRGATMAKKDKNLKRQKLAKKADKGTKKEKKKSNIELDRSDVKPPSPFSS